MTHLIDTDTCLFLLSSQYIRMIGWVWTSVIIFFVFITPTKMMSNCAEIHKIFQPMRTHRGASKPSYINNMCCPLSAICLSYNYGRWMTGFHSQVTHRKLTAYIFTGFSDMPQTLLNVEKVPKVRSASSDVPFKLIAINAYFWFSLKNINYWPLSCNADTNHQQAASGDHGASVL